MAFRHANLSCLPNRRLQVLNHWYGRDDIPVGAFKGQFGHNATSRYVPDLVANFPSPVKNYSQVPDALDVYRSVLAAQPDHSVAISSIGFLTNLAALLKSGPDAHSPLTGVELVAQKVKRVAIMGGAYPATAPGSKQGEFNLGCGNGLDGPALECAGTAKYVVDKLPAGVELIFSGFEVGVRIETGAVLTTCAPAANPCRQAYIDFLGGPNRNRMSWDPATTLFAVTGDPGSIGCSTAGQGGHNNVTAVGTNSWQAGQQPAGRAESYLVLEGVQGVAKAAKAIDDLLCVAPK